MILHRLVALFVTIALGLLSRLYPIGWSLYDKSLGDVLYAVAAYLAIALVSGRPWWIVAPVALIVCEAIEFFQATGVPAQLAAQYPLVRWLLGTTFAWHDVVCYIVGVAAITLIDVALFDPKRRRPK